MKRFDPRKIIEFQEAIYSRLKNLPGVNGVFDYVPEDTKFPYIVLGRAYAEPEYTKTTTGERIEITIDVWSGAKGKREAVEIINAISEALENDLEIPEAVTLDQGIRNIEVLQEINDLFRGTVTFEIIIDLEG